ncbi:hypothetical protein UFOVP464_17 [uncultured Caudovirales phage]|uniref:Uncharacterized protein n=1 Tax=uncultured Caudovirales phage TaxID=2100421 RepID=A0A6J5MCZ8_9CAUD|nr:hypothetical protein UFOVP464_17 [uncultured Caudovirales phage]CAB4189268.1 hypothetical protein UFOVP1189_32 [uncultured Caudovirales phage]
MAAKSGANAAGTSAGQVYVSLRADLSQLEADLDKAKGMVAGTAKTGVTGGGSDIISAAKAQATAQDTIAASATRSSAAISQVGFASREAARDVRTQVATIKDQLNDTTAFSGAGFADLLFGIDNDRIAATRFGGALADLQKQKVRLDAELIRDPGNKALVQQLFEVNKGIKINQDGLDGIQKKWSGFTGAVRGAGATIATSLASSFLIGAGIGLATAAIQGLLDVGSQIIDKLVNPTKYAAEAFKDLAAAVQKAGGGDAFASMLGLTGPLAEMARLAGQANSFNANQSSLLALAKSGNAQGVYGLTPVQAAYAENRKAFIAAGSEGVSGQKQAEAVAAAFGPAATKSMADAMRNGAYYSQALRTALGGVFDEARGAAYTAGRNQLMTQGFDLNRQLTMLRGGAPADGYTPIEKLQRSISSDQAKLAAVSAGGQYAQITRTLQDARLAVARAGVSGGQETVFDVAIRRSEALESLKRAREDASRQRAALSIQSRIADKTAELEKKNKEIEILASLKEIDKKLGGGFVITSEGAAPTKDEVAKAVNTLNTYWVGRTTRMIPK